MDCGYLLPFTITVTDSLGMTLEAPDGSTCRLTDRDQLTGWTKVKKPRKRKAKTNDSQGQVPLLFGSDP